MDDLGGDLLRSLVRGLYLLVRLALWLAFELLVEVIAWWVGWCVCRGGSLNAFPRERIGEYDRASRSVALAVCVTGMLALLLLGAALARVAGSGAG
ncbi:hypothetical protein [Azotobacter salinestris]|uniref:hypothetical protein n=1 Tax=Azotobacter salinestris TaxID=69964 RepID=UPI001266DF9B|nr:hypothetical protein [Azotobacter salinestris]